jgi:hypothetical protein
MSKDTVKHIIKETTGAARRLSAIHRRHPEPHHERRDERVVLWYGGQKVELSVEAWIRGH